MNARVESPAARVTAPAPHAAPRATLFVVLWIVWAALLATAMLLGNFLSGHSAPAATTARMGSSVALVITAWIAYGLWRHAAVGRFALLIAIGMTLGAIGDFFNAGLLNFIPLPDPVLGGIGAFGLGHIAYIAGCLGLGRRAGLTDRSKMIAAVVVWQLVGIVAWYFVVMQGSENRDLVWPSLPYSLLLAGTTGVATGLALQDRRLCWLAVGAALFLASDLILAFGLFGDGFSHQTEAVWLTYGPGQMLIVFSVLSAALVLGTRGLRNAA
ncbi:MAG: lysoplasmalogenase [Pirellulales bacterium]